MFARMSLTSTNESLQLLAFLGGETDDVLLVHGENSRWLDATEGTRSLFTAQLNYDRGLAGF
jgi:hypothetical protein